MSKRATSTVWEIWQGDRADFFFFFNTSRNRLVKSFVLRYRERG